MRRKIFEAKSLKTLLDEDTRRQLEEWRKFYKEVFNTQIEIKNIPIPERQLHFNQLIVRAKGMTTRRIWNEFKNLFPVFSPDGLHNIVSVRKAVKHYAIWIRDEREADEKLFARSARDLLFQNINSITLEERLLFELFSWWKNKQHLDLKTQTLCAGSRRLGGQVPVVLYFKSCGWLEVNWVCDHEKARYLRAREVIQ